MCRITGFWDFQYKGSYDIKQVIESMRDTMTYGGPDDAGLYIDKYKGLALGHRRLSILDLSEKGHQPMEFQNLVIAHNGEVYNFREIRIELEELGYEFISNSDTEVILKAFHRWGIESVHKFRGMWVFAIWDKKHQKLILCRDRVGVKPLYWYYNENLFMFSSELKAFHNNLQFRKDIDETALSLYLQYGYITAPHSIFKNTFKLEPGYFLILDKNGQISKTKYWDVQDYFIKGYLEKDKWLKRDENDISEELEAILTDSFKLRMIADVPIGIFLSGGIDSSLVTALLQREYSKPLKTFTIGFYEKEYNEANWAKKIARHLGTEHSELYCTTKEAFEIISKFPELYDEPFGDSSAIPTFLVSKLAKEQVKVSLSADGGDEQFCGYTRYWIIGDNFKKLSMIPFLNQVSAILDLVNPDFAFALYNKFKFILPKWPNFKDKYKKLSNVLKAKDVMEQYDILTMFFLPKDIKELGLQKSGSNLFKFYDYEVNRYDRVTQLMFIDLKTYLPDDIFVKVDRATMGVSLEGREPLLDNKILEYSAQLPLELKYRDNVSKHILRKILYKYIPKELIERPKQGFSVPIYDWFKADLKDLYIQYLSESRIKSGGFFNAKEVGALLNDYIEDKGIDYNKIWLLFVFEMWKEKWLT
jgi:asparagine synthase (glutamine-hydrolysing)